MRKLDKHAARATARVEREAPDSKDTATFLRRARAASLKAIGSRFGALAEEEYDKIAPVIACTLPALTDSIPERKRGELAGEVTSELQVVGKAASIAIQTWVRNNDKTKARAEEREKNIGWIKRLFTAWRVSHTERTERRAERKEDGEDDSEEDEPVEIQLSDVTMHPKGTPAPASSVEARVFEERVDLSNNMTWRQMIGVGVRNVVLARGELDRLEGPGYAARRAELRRKAKEAERTRERQAAAAASEAKRADYPHEQLRENVEFVMDGLEAATQAARNPSGSNIQVAYSLPPEGGSGFGDLVYATVPLGSVATKVARDWLANELYEPSRRGKIDAACRDRKVADLITAAGASAPADAVFSGRFATGEAPRPTTSASKADEGDGVGGDGGTGFDLFGPDPTPMEDL